MKKVWFIQGDDSGQDSDFESEYILAQLLRGLLYVLALDSEAYDHVPPEVVGNMALEIGILETSRS